MSQSGNDSAADQKFLAIKGDLEALFPVQWYMLNRALLIAIEIDFKDNHRPRKIVIEVKSGEDTYKSRPFERNEAVHWDFENSIYPSLSVDLNITVQEVRVLPSGGHSSVFNISPLDVIGKGTFSAQDNLGRIAVTLTCGSELSIDSLAERLVEEAHTAVGEKKVLLDSLGKFSKFLDVIMALSDGVTDVHIGSKGAAVLACALFERCKTQQRCHEEAAKLMEELSSFLPFTGDGFLGLMENERTKQVVKEMLELFCDISKLIIRYSSKGILGDLIFSRRDDIGKATDAFKKLKETFNWYVKAEVWRSVISTEIRAETLSLQQLHPARRAYYDNSDGKMCLEGTRKPVLKQVEDWAVSDSKLFWLHGLAGSGKSAIANSVAHMLEQQQLLFGCFFCKRDDPECHNPMNLFPTLAYHFSKWHMTYRSLVLSVIHGVDEPKLAQSLHWQFELLLRKPLMSLATAAVDLPPLVVVIDALDECGDLPESRLELAKYLVELSNVVPWLRVFITSRPLPELKQIFLAEEFQSLDINEELGSVQVHKDILLYTKHCAQNLNLTGDQIESLALKASGLFIWTSTVFRFIKMQLNQQRAVQGILSQSSAGKPESELDQIYKTVLQSVAEGPDNAEIIKSVIGVVVCASKNRPLPESALLEFLSSMENDVDLPKALYWLECLSLMEELKSGINILELFSRNYKPTGMLAAAGKDLHRILTAYYTPISVSTPHLYISALSWTPTESYIDEQLYPHFKNQPLIRAGGEEKWNPNIWTANAGSDVLCVTYSPDGRYTVSGSKDSTLRIWDAQTGNSVGEPLTGHSNWVYSVAYSPDGRHIVSGSHDNTLRIWDAQTGNPMGEPLGHSDSVRSVAYSPDGRHIVSGSDDRTLRIWDAQTRGPVGEPLRGHSHYISCVAYSPDGSHIVSGSLDDTLRIWDAQTGSAVGELLIGHSVSSIAYSPDGRHIVSGSDDNTLRTWDAQTGIPVGEALTGHSATVRSVAYSPDGRHIVSGSDDNTLRIWDAQTGSTVGEPLTGHSGYVVSVAYSLLRSKDWGAVRVMDASQTKSMGRDNEVGDEDGDDEVLREAHAIDVLVLSRVTTKSMLDSRTYGIWENEVEHVRDGRHILSGSDDNTLKIWDAQTGSAVGEPLRGHSHYISCVAYSPDGRHIVSGSFDKILRIWDAQTGSAVGEPLTGHSNGVSSVAYSPDGRYIVSGSDDNTLRIWDAQTGSAVGEPLTGHSNGVSSVAYSPDGRHIVSGSWDKTLRIWDAQTGNPVGEPLTGHSNWFYSVAYSPDGRHIVSGLFDKTLRIWDAHTGNTVGEPLRGHSDYVRSVAYSPDGRHIVSGSQDKTLRIWDASVVHTGFEVGRSYSLNRIDNDGWVKDSSGNLLLWVPHMYCTGICDMSMMCIPSFVGGQSVKVNWERLMEYSGSSWVNIVKHS
ncbi:hypothetical protein M0805_008673 [Coniferiporia weirii]|nr:hypothetical protein M0805_008673 [Coniferiporia weirii]